MELITKTDGFIPKIDGFYDYNYQNFKKLINFLEVLTAFST